MSKQDRQGVRSAVNLEQKWNFGKQFAEVMGVALDTQKNLTIAEATLNNKLTEQYSSLTRTTEQIQMEVDEVETEMGDVRDTITEQRTSLLETCESIVKTATDTLVEESDFATYKATKETEFATYSTGIEARVSEAEERIETVNGTLQEQLNTITKYFTFNVDGLTIGQENNPNKVVIDNDDITIFVQDKEVVTFKADGTGVIPDLRVTNTANILGLQFTQDSTHINIDFTGEVT